MKKVWPVAVPLLFLALQALSFALPISRPAAYVVMVLAPVLTAVVLVRRGLSERGPVAMGWYAAAVSLLLWAVGAFGNLWQEWILGRVNEMYRASMLMFNLAAVPIAFTLASGGRPAGRLARGIDGVMASALGYGFFSFTWAMMTTWSALDGEGVQYMVWLLDAANLYLALGGLARWYAADDRPARELFRALAAYLCAYTVILFVNNHYLATNPELGPEHGSIITFAFALLTALALWPSGEVRRRSARWLVRVIHTTSPLMLAGALLLVSLFLIRFEYALGTFGVVIAVLGYATRTTRSQVEFIEHGEGLEAEQSKLQRIVQTDALTGVGNRYFLEQALREAKQKTGPGGQLSVLMIDIDFFKLLNDRYGHVAGDACLRSVASALQRALARPSDVLARYGGEEFIALLHGTDDSGAKIVAERIRAAVQTLHIEHLGSPFGTVTVSVGAATASPEKTLADVLVEAADHALYEAKRSGRNQIKGAVVA